jgi:hypothetical protein
VLLTYPNILFFFEVVSKSLCRLPLASLELVVDGLVTSQNRPTTGPQRTTHSGQYVLQATAELGMRSGNTARGKRIGPELSQSLGRSRLQRFGE